MSRRTRCPTCHRPIDSKLANRIAYEKKERTKLEFAKYVAPDPMRALVAMRTGNIVLEALDALIKRSKKK